MIRPEPKVVKAVASAVRQYPEIMQFLDTWRTHELEMLPNAINNPAISQGRCQVLGELYRFAKDAPELAAKI
jgi:gamma-glutamylcyclotransferase (GGCT)/AIG2-like uncharacterized protein YtfP